MSHNPYAPPSAVVADLAETPASLARPEQVTVAVRLFWMSLIIGVPGGVYQMFTSDTPEMPRGVLIALTLIGWALTWGIAFWLLTELGRGKNWARIVQAVLNGLGLLVGFWMARLMFALSFYHGTIFLIQTVLTLVALVLLFRPASNAWYRAIKNQ